MPLPSHGVGLCGRERLRSTPEGGGHEKKFATGGKNKMVSTCVCVLFWALEWAAKQDIICRGLTKSCCGALYDQAIHHTSCFQRIESTSFVYKASSESVDEPRSSQREGDLKSHLEAEGTRPGEALGSAKRYRRGAI